ncbi:MAG: 50S ribosomal protein L30e [Halobacteriota archaeon]|nr:50S ribosomal protein L30e [Halobacteriota archaeon]
MDLNKTLRSAIRTGEVLLGSNETVDSVKNKKAKLVILASNSPASVEKAIEGEDVPVFEYPGGSGDLGSACGKPFSVAALAVIDPGESEILSLKGTQKG